MQIHLREAAPGKSTPNCVDCSRSIVHVECSVLHLVDAGWTIERGLLRNRGERSERSEVEAQQARRVRE